MTEREKAAIREALAAGNEHMRAEHRLSWNGDDVMIARRVYADYMMLASLDERQDEECVSEFMHQTKDQALNRRAEPA